MAAFKIEGKTIECSLQDLEMNHLPIRSMPYNYNVTFVNERELKARLKEIGDTNKKKNFVFIDQIVGSLYGRSVFAGVLRVPVLARESNKSLPVVTRLLDKLQEKSFTKKEIFLSAGGGITQDISSFARAVFKRGIHWTYVPTTLLAMADSCIGAKACLNYDKVKNLLGLFSAPREVLVYPGFLDTLSERDVLSGYGEIVKLAIVGGHAGIEKFSAISKEQRGNSRKHVEQMCKLALSVKKSVIEIDEFESDIRRALNYGHTVGHAIEPLANYKIPHGIAVSIGMMIENLMAVQWGALPREEANSLNELIRPLIDDASLASLRKVSPAAVIKNMKRDKKALNNDIYLSVPKEIGHFDMLKVKSDKSLDQFLRDSIKRVTAS